MIEIVGNKVFSKNDSLADDPAYFYGIRTYAKRVNISGNNVRIVHSRGNGEDYGIYSRGRLNVMNGNILGNTVEINVSSAKKTYGVFTYGVTPSGRAVVDNIIKLDNDNITQSHYGIYINDRGNTIGNNQIDMVNNDAKDIGVRMVLNADNNQGTDNKIGNAGTDISDSGANNTINVVDGGSW